MSIESSFGPHDRAINIEEVAKTTSLSKSTIKRLTGDPTSDFPRPFTICESRKAWMLSEVLGWLKTRFALRDQVTCPTHPRRRQTSTGSTV